MNQHSERIIRCAECGARNRIPLERLQEDGSPSEKVKCGKCHRPLTPAGGMEAYKLRCLGCGAKNRIPADRIEEGGKCGKCGEPLATDRLFVPQPMMVTDANLDQTVLKSPVPVLLYAWAPW